MSYERTHQRAAPGDGAPSSEASSTASKQLAPPALRDDALARLEWPHLAQALASECLLPGNRERLASLTPWVAREERDWWLLATAEWIEVLAAQKAVALEPFDFEQVRAPLARAAVLSGQGLFEILRQLRSCRDAHEYVRTERRQPSGPKAARVVELLAQIEPQPRLLAALSISVDENGNLLSSASPELKAARGRLEAARKRIVDALESLMRRASVRDALQDAVWMMRDGRYVLPVRTDRKSDVGGVPRGVSQSGSTVFVEPTELAGAQQLVEQAEVDVQLEEARVLRQLSEQAAAVRDSLSASAEVLAKYDELSARCKFALAVRGVPPTFHAVRATQPAFSFKDACHPLFLLEKKPCVANDLVLAHPQHAEKETQPRVWILSGPNAGGKTVAMRTVGLLTLMARAGLYVPASEALLYEFEDVFVELGDRQSREEDLSTFSGHLLHVKRVLELASEKTLVLLDEGFVGTDPAVGASMARATLEFLADRNATAIITTHFSSLKTIADSDARFTNASMEFEPTALRPIYTLLNGVPGQSYALELATRLGFEPRILERARALYGEEAQKLESLLAELQRKRAALSDELDAARAATKRLEDEVKSLFSERKSIEDLRGTLVEGYRTRLQKRLNAFENRLEIRERQFERHKEGLLREFRETRDNQSVSALGAGEESAPSGIQSGTEHEPERRRVPPGASASQSQAHSERVQDRSIDAKGRAPALSDFSSLAQFQFPKRSGDTPPERGVSASGKTLDERASKFRPPARMTPRDLLDEARESLETLGRGMDDIGEEFDADVDELTGLGEKVQARAHKAKDAARALQKTPDAARAPSYWQPKMRVKSQKWKEVGEVLRAVDAKGFVEVQFGLLKAKVHHAELLTLNEAASQKSKAAGSAPSPRGPQPAALASRSAAMKSPHGARPKGDKIRNTLDMMIDMALPHGGNTVDLRGQLVDVALEKLEQFLDKAWRQDINPVIVVHGHGTGRVKQAVREYLEKCDYTLAFRPGSSGEGGDGATVVQFR